MCNQVIWTTSCKVMAKILQYISIYFRKSWMTLDDHKVHQKPKLFCERYALDYLWPPLWTPELPKTNVSFRYSSFPSDILVNKPLKAQSQIQNEEKLQLQIKNWKLKLKNSGWSPLQVARPLTMKKDGIQTRNRKLSAKVSSTTCQVQNTTKV